MAAAVQPHRPEATGVTPCRHRVSSHHGTRLHAQASALEGGVCKAIGRERPGYYFSIYFSCHTSRLFYVALNKTSSSLKFTISSNEDKRCQIANSGHTWLQTVITVLETFKNAFPCCTKGKWLTRLVGHRDFRQWAVRVWWCCDRHIGLTGPDKKPRTPSHHSWFHV